MTDEQTPQQPAAPQEPAAPAPPAPPAPDASQDPQPTPTPSSQDTLGPSAVVQTAAPAADAETAPPAPPAPSDPPAAPEPAPAAAPTPDASAGTPLAQVNPEPAPAAPSVPPVKVDQFTRRNDDDALEGSFVQVVDGEHAGQIASFTKVDQSDPETGYPDTIILKFRDASYTHEYATVEYSKVRPAPHGGV